MDYFKLSENSINYSNIKQQFMALYIDVFSGYPYFESFSKEEVSDMFDSYSKSDSCLYCAIQENLLIGFGAGTPLKNCLTDFKNIVKKHLDIDIEECYYNADVAVLKHCRNQGIGTKLIELRINEATANGFKYMVVRTIKEGSFSKEIYQRHGFLILNETQLIKHDRVHDTIPDIDERIILWKEL